MNWIEEELKDLKRLFRNRAYENSVQRIFLNVTDVQGSVLQPILTIRKGSCLVKRRKGIAYDLIHVRFVSQSRFWTAKKVCFRIQMIFSEMGLHQTLLNENGTVFRSLSKYGMLLEKWHIQQMWLSCANLPQGNGMNDTSRNLRTIYSSKVLSAYSLKSIFRGRIFLWIFRPSEDFLGQAWKLYERRTFTVRAKPRLTTSPPNPKSPLQPLLCQVFQAVELKSINFLLKLYKSTHIQAHNTECNTSYNC